MSQQVERGSLRVGDVVVIDGGWQLIGHINPCGGQCNCCDALPPGHKSQVELVGNVFEKPELLREIPRE